MLPNAIDTLGLNLGIASGAARTQLQLDAADILAPIAAAGLASPLSAGVVIRANSFSKGLDPLGDLDQNASELKPLPVQLRSATKSSDRPGDAMLNLTNRVPDAWLIGDRQSRYLRA